MNIIKHNGLVAEHTSKSEIRQLLPKYKHGNDIHKQKKISKTNEPHKFVLNWSQQLDLRSSNKYVSLQKLSLYRPWKNIR